MLLSFEKQLKDLILELFAVEPMWSASQIATRIRTATGRTYALSSLYKELGKLEAEGVVIKRGRMYMLSLSWVLDMNRFVRAAYNEALSPACMTQLLPPPQGSARWTFSSLREMDLFWMQVVFALFEISDDKVMYEYVPYLWFPMLSWEKDDQYLRAQALLGARIKLIVGGTTFIDRTSPTRWPSDLYEISYAKSDFHRERSTNYCLIGDYLIVVRIDFRATRKIDALFKQVRAWTDLDPSHVYEVFDGPSRSTLSVYHNARKAESLRERFESHRWRG